MSHQFLDGTIYHKRFAPKIHDFKYKYFMVDIDLSNLTKLRNRFFSLNRFNLFSFYSKDHFGKDEDFIKNVEDISEKFGLDSTMKMRFITLPRVIGFVFNPISILLFFKEDKPYFMLAEVHNYNGGRVVYPVELKSVDGKNYSGKSIKDMYVSPFSKREGDYKFNLLNFRTLN